MLAIGCLLPVLLSIGGTVVGAMLGGQQGALVVGGGGAAVGIGIPAATMLALAAQRRKR